MVPHLVTELKNHTKPKYQIYDISQLTRPDHSRPLSSGDIDKVEQLTTYPTSPPPTSCLLASPPADGCHSNSQHCRNRIHLPPPSRSPTIVRAALLPLPFLSAYPQMAPASTPITTIPDTASASMPSRGQVTAVRLRLSPCSLFAASAPLLPRSRPPDLLSRLVVLSSSASTLTQLPCNKTGVNIA